MIHAVKCIIVTISIICTTSITCAAEYPIGKPYIQNGMEINMVYLQPVKMEPDKIMRAPEASDIHLEADIHAMSNNIQGFAEGDWIPYLKIKFIFKKFGTQKTITGDMIPMIANDGPHYGNNVKLDGPGKYQLQIIISPPTANYNIHFGRHIDKETGVSPWFQTFELHHIFIYAGIGKKGRY